MMAGDEKVARCCSTRIDNIRAILTKYAADCELNSELEELQDDITGVHSQDDEALRPPDSAAEHE